MSVHFNIDMDRQCKCGSMGLLNDTGFCLKCAGKEIVKNIKRERREKTMSSNPEVIFNGLVKTVQTTLKEEKDPETKEVTGYHTETKVAIQAIELDDETLRMLAASAERRRAGDYGLSAAGRAVQGPVQGRRGSLKTWKR